MDHIAVIESQIAKKRSFRARSVAARAAVDEAISKSDTEIATLEELLKLLKGEEKSHINGVESASRHLHRPQGDTFEKLGDYRKGPKGVWRVIMPEMLRQYPSGTFKLGDVEAAAQLTAQDAKADTIRSQMANYVGKGLLSRVGPGTFRFTEQGRTTFASFLEDNPSSGLEKSPPTHDAQVGGVSSGQRKPDLLASDLYR